MGSLGQASNPAGHRRGSHQYVSWPARHEGPQDGGHWDGPNKV